MLICFFLEPPAGRLSLEERHSRFNILAEGQGSPRQPIMYKQYPFSEQKQRAAKVKVTDPTWGQNWLLSETLLPWDPC